MKKPIVDFQLGKQGITDNFIDCLVKTFKKHELIKIAVLKSCSRSREEVNKIAIELCEKLKKIENKNFTFKIIGFTIFLRKWRKKLQK